MEADRTRRQSEGPPSAAILAETRQTCRFNVLCTNFKKVPYLKYLLKIINALRQDPGLDGGILFLKNWNPIRDTSCHRWTVLNLVRTRVNLVVVLLVLVYKLS